MFQLKQPRRVILTGAVGAGKTSILQHLADHYLTIAEPAREILAEQRQFQGHAVPEVSPACFCACLLSRAIKQYQAPKDEQHDIIIYDRGIPDTIVYADWFHLDTGSYERASRHFQYATRVFFFPAWEEIYHCDDERKMSFEQAKRFAEQLKVAYTRLGYQLLEVPKTSIQARCQFILHEMTNGSDL